MQSDTQSKKTLSAADLAQFTGTEQWFRHSINSKVLYTEGAQYLAELRKLIESPALMLF